MHCCPLLFSFFFSGLFLAVNGVRSRADTTFTRQLLECHNKLRIEKGLTPLIMDNQINHVALIRAGILVTNSKYKEKENPNYDESTLFSKDVISSKDFCNALSLQSNEAAYYNMVMPNLTKMGVGRARQAGNSAACAYYYPRQLPKPKIPNVSEKSFAEQILDCHNEYRSSEYSPLRLNTEMNIDAQEKAGWVVLADNYSPKTIYHAHDKYDENVFVKYGEPVTAQEVCDEWFADAAITANPEHPGYYNLETATEVRVTRGTGKEIGVGIGTLKQKTLVLVFYHPMDSYWRMMLRGFANVVRSSWLVYFIILICLKFS